METINVHAAKTQLSRLLDAVAAGKEIIIAKADKPVARLVPLDNRKQPRQFGTLAGEFSVPEDFDEPCLTRCWPASKGADAPPARHASPIVGAR
jgi:prevent-host-death family protein